MSFKQFPVNNTSSPLASMKGDHVAVRVPDFEAARRRESDHYKLDRLRSVVWSQDHRQRLNTLLAAGQVGFPELSRHPREVLSEFRRRHGFKVGYREFLDWYRKVLPADYAAVFR